jgi:hypothetical protein
MYVIVHLTHCISLDLPFTASPPFQKVGNEEEKFFAIDFSANSSALCGRSLCVTRMCVFFNAFARHRCGFNPSDFQ